MDIAQIWTEYRAGLKSFLHSRVSNPSDVDDLLQEILIKTHQSLHTLRSESSIKAWLYQMANRVIIDFYRRRARTRDLERGDLWYDEDAVDVQQSLVRCVEPFVRALPAESAELLATIDLDGQSQKDEALRRGISYSTLKSRVQKGRQELRALFEKCCHLTLDQHGNVIEYSPKSGHCDPC